jgi:hypothetical protein
MRRVLVILGAGFIAFLCAGPCEAFDKEPLYQEFGEIDASTSQMPPCNAPPLCCACLRSAWDGYARCKNDCGLLMFFPAARVICLDNCLKTYAKDKLQCTYDNFCG